MEQMKCFSESRLFKVTRKPGFGDECVTIICFAKDEQEAIQFARDESIDFRNEKNIAVAAITSSSAGIVAREYASW